MSGLQTVARGGHVPQALKPQMSLFNSRHSRAHARLWRHAMVVFAFMLELIMESLLPGLIQLFQTTTYCILPQQWVLLYILSRQYNQISAKHQIFVNSSSHQT